MAKPEPGRKALRFALVGGETLLGKELQEVIESRNKGASITQYAASGEGNFGEQEGEAVYLEPLNAAALSRADAVLIAGSGEGAQKAYTLAKSGASRPVVIDCTGQLEQQPEARILSPITGEGFANQTWLVVVAHPAAMAIGLVLQKLTSYRPVQRTVAHIFEPASERGKHGVSELHQQTTSLLSFKPLEKSIFDAQLAFNLLPQYGEEAPGKLSTAEQRIERHVATILANQPQQNIPMPSLRLIQAPVFHGYSISLWAEFTGNVKVQELGEALASAQIEVRGPNDEAPNSVGAASQSGLLAGDIRLDHNNPHAAWFWVVGDNLRLTADAAADIVSELGIRAQ